MKSTNITIIALSTILCACGAPKKSTLADSIPIDSLEEATQTPIVTAGKHTALHSAVSQNDTELVKSLIATGANINAADEIGRTPLMLAVDSNRFQIAQQLLDAGANTNLVNSDGWSALHFTANLMHDASHDSAKMVDMLIAHGALVDAQKNDGATTMILAIQNNKINVFHALLKAKTDLYLETNEGMTPLLEAAKLNRIDMVKSLIAVNAPLNSRNNEGYSALHFTVADPLNPDNDNVELANILIKAGIDINQQTVNGATALFLAVQNNRPQVFDLLLQNNADVSIKQNNIWTPLMLAIRDNNIPMANQLLDAEAKAKLLRDAEEAKAHAESNVIE